MSEAEEPTDDAATDALERAEQLLERLERSREALETTDDPEQAIEVLSELAEIAKQIEVEISEAKRRAELGEGESGADA
jgi:hypothetical protein